ncbi:hypothetical protein AB0J84_28560 [Micromonospora arborensis]|uniref:hypothetical protein n=1 Tax=Micromonospora arborensis TaxID=2116518 RepID=UPI00342552B4
MGGWFDRCGGALRRGWRQLVPILLLGRVALVALAVIVGSLIPGALEGVGTSAFGTDPLASPGTAAGAVVVIGVTAVLARRPISPS